MEPWSFSSEGKGFSFADEMDVPINAYAKSTKAFVEWDNRTCFSFDKEFVERMELMDLGLPDAMKQSFHGDQVVDVLNSSSNTVASPTCLMTSSSSWGDGESGSKFSSLDCESSSQDSSLIALKLGRMDGSKYGKGSQCLNERSKRARTKGSCYQIVMCQVRGCNMNLSSSKEYHKRHRVCDAHSKTPIVVVNGVEQRFCQQCSRFHLVAEFDDVKRSCRRRLAGHNQRRRKPHLDSFDCKSYNWLQSYQDIVPGGVLNPEEINHYGRFKSEDVLTYRPCAAPTSNNHFVPNYFLHLHGPKQHASGVHIPGNESLVFDTTSDARKASGASTYQGVLSLLSSQSQSSIHSARNQAGNPLQLQRNHHGAGRSNEWRSTVNAFEKCGCDGSFSCRKNSTGISQMDSMVIYDSNNVVDFQRHSDTIQGSACFSHKYQHPSPDNGPTFDLL